VIRCSDHCATESTIHKQVNSSKKSIQKRNLITIDNKPTHVYIASEDKISAIFYTRLKILAKTGFYMNPSKTVA